MDQPPPSLETRARTFALTLTRWPSVTGTSDEAAFPGKLAATLGGIDYFREHPDHLTVEPIPGDPFGRSNLVAFVAGSGTSCVVLSGHFDTVPFDDYGDLAPLATEPEALRTALRSRLRQSGTHPLGRADLDGEEFLPGRGLLDMKSGLAAGIAVLADFAADPTRTGNLILLATPDEEDRSVGMRDAAARLPGRLSRLGLSARLAINLDALIDTGDGGNGRVVALGCIGKLLLSALVVGRETHACYPLAGVNAAHLAAELVCALECAPELAERDGEEMAAPPTVLGSRDLKTVYNVTTPDRAWITWNVLTRHRSSHDVLRIATRLAHEAVQRARERLTGRAARVSAGDDTCRAWHQVPVMTFEDLRGKALGREPAFEARFAAEAAALAGRADLDLPTRCRILAELTWEAAGVEGPAVVLGFGSLPYPAVTMPVTGTCAALESRIRATTETVAARHGVSIKVVRQLPVIVDMSFLGITDADDLRYTARNTPIWGSSITWDLSGTATAGIPTINIGPWGRDYHHWLERVHAPYAFGVLPDLVREVAKAALED